MKGLSVLPLWVRVMAEPGSKDGHPIKDKPRKSIASRKEVLRMATLAPDASFPQALLIRKNRSSKSRK